MRGHPRHWQGMRLGSRCPCMMMDTLPTASQSLLEVRADRRRRVSPSPRPVQVPSPGVGLERPGPTGANPTRLASLSGRPGRTRDMTLPLAPQADLRGSLLWAIMIASATHTADAMTGACQWWGGGCGHGKVMFEPKQKPLKQRERPPAVARAWAFVGPSLQVGNLKGRAVKFRHLHRASRIAGTGIYVPPRLRSCHWPRIL
jgi:hypothetical protein